MLEIYEKIMELINSGEDFAVATIVSTSRTYPRGAGSKMVVSNNKVVAGSVGGGCLEMSVLADASKAIAEDSCLLKNYGIGCQNKSDGKRGDSEATIFIEVNKAARRLVIFGGGHVGQALAHAAAFVGFPLTVIDPRDSVATPDKFPSGTRIIYANPDSGEALSHIRKGCYVVVMTHDHRLDAAVLGKALACEADYIGMIAGRHKVKDVFSILKKNGASDEKLSAVHTPIGLDIGAETPAEIAVSIVAEIINHCKKANVSPESLKIKKKMDLSEID